MQLMSIPEIAEFVARLLKQTRKGAVAWKESGTDALEADLGSGYSVRLRLVADLDGETSGEDHLLLVQKGGADLFTVDRRYVSATDLSKALDEQVDYSFAVFDELWTRALLKGRKVSDHIAALNTLLMDDDEVPF